MSRITTSVYDYDEKTVIFTIFFSECRANLVEAGKNTDLPPRVLTGVTLDSIFSVQRIHFANVHICLDHR